MRFGEYLVDKMKAELEDKGKRATGDLIDTMRPYTEAEDGKSFLYVEMQEYAQNVDAGRAAGKRMPPDEPIRKWITDKGIRGRHKNGRFMKVKTLSYLIRRSIGIRGIDPTPFLYLFQDLADDLNDIVEDAATVDVQRKLDEYIINFNNKNK